MQEGHPPSCPYESSQSGLEEKKLTLSLRDQRSDWGEGGQELYLK